jgi:hypothetical protein
MTGPGWVQILVWLLMMGGIASEVWVIQLHRSRPVSCTHRRTGGHVFTAALGLLLSGLAPFAGYPAVALCLLGLSVSEVAVAVLHWRAGAEVVHE